jgi:hypothetical protein
MINDTRIRIICGIIFIIAIGIPAITILPYKSNNIQGIETIQSNNNTTNWLYKFAQDKMNDLTTSAYWSHTNSNGCNFTCRTKYLLDKNNVTWIGEDLYKGTCDLNYTMKLWNESPDHKAILDHAYTREVLITEKVNNTCFTILERIQEVK